MVGFLTLEQGKAYVPHVFVDGDWRFCGVGSGLLQVARNFVGRPLKLDVDIQNAAAIEAYTALGWREQAKVGRGSREHGAAWSGLSANISERVAGGRDLE